MMERTKTLDLSKYRDLDIKTVTVKVLQGPDIVQAAELCVKPNGDLMEGGQFGLNLRLQCISRSIVKVNGQPVIGTSCSQFFDWSKRTQDFCGKVYDHLNSLSTEESDDFQARLDAAAYDAAQPTSSTQG